MKKLKLVWILSDSVVGHELQSVSLALNISVDYDLFHCSIRQPWLSFAPRIVPGFGRNIIWEHTHKPNWSNLPDVVITTGRRMAAVGKYIKRKYGIKHIQILNPKDHAKNYDLLICPKHDQLQGKNIIQTTGSLHQYNLKKLNELRKLWQPKINPENNKSLSLFVGNPSMDFFRNLDRLNSQIKKYFNEYQLFISASRRTKERYKKQIKKVFNNAKLVWFSPKDGENPYQGLLSCSDAFLVTADSINMVTEACATNKPVIVVGRQYVSPKHKRFLDSLGDRVESIDCLQMKQQTPLNSMNDVAEKVLIRLD